jgi:hypothetical protein
VTRAQRLRAAVSGESVVDLDAQVALVERMADVRLEDARGDEEGEPLADPLRAADLDAVAEDAELGCARDPRRADPAVRVAEHPLDEARA